MWITDYCHEMDNHGKILEFLKGAALRPYIDRLNEEEQKVFMDEVIFKRLFCFRVEKIYDKMSKNLESRDLEG